MSYENAEPKILKSLNSAGQVLDDSGNVIADTSDYWVKTYNQAEPKPDKILHSDGTIKDSAGNLIQDTTEFNVKKYNQAEPIPAKYLHSDGTIDENAGGGSGADLEDNHQTTIDVSQYSEPVEITPTAGKDGMKKATVILDNIPSGGGFTAYCWVNQNEENIYLNISESPTSLLEYESTKKLNGYVIEPVESKTEFERISDSEFKVGAEVISGYITWTIYTRNVEEDITLPSDWNSKN